MRRRRIAIAVAIAFGFLFSVPASDAQSPAAPEANPADIAQAITLVCPGHEVTLSEDGIVDGCKSCPDGTDLYEKSAESWLLQRAISGRFTSKQDENLLLQGTGCDSPNNSAGGTFVFVAKAGQISLLKYAEGFSIEGCGKFSYLDGSNALVCRLKSSSQEWIREVVTIVRFDATGAYCPQYLFLARDTTGECAQRPREPVEESRIIDVQFSRSSSGALSGLTVTATYRSVKCSQLASQNKNRTYKVRFVFNGKRFKVALKGKEAYDLFFSPVVTVETS